MVVSTVSTEWILKYIFLILWPPGMKLYSSQLYCVGDRYLQIVTIRTKTSCIVRHHLDINIFLLFLFSKHSLNSFYIGSFLLPSSIIKISTGYHFTQPLPAYHIKVKWTSSRHVMELTSEKKVQNLELERR